MQITETEREKILKALGRVDRENRELRIMFSELKVKTTNFHKESIELCKQLVK